MDLTKFNKKQIESITTDIEQVAVIAPPGSGKSTSMVGAIEYYLEKNPNASAIAITFTVKGAEDLKSKINSKKVRTSTIHSWSQTELIILSRKYGFRVKILQEAQIEEIIKPFMQLKRLNIRNQYTVGAVLRHCLGMINSDLDIYTKNVYDEISDMYTAYKRKMFLYDFTDTPMYLYQKLKDYNEYIYTDALFVDEFQDVDPTQLEIFERVIAKKKYFIGDPDQAIYGFRGATDKIFDILANLGFTAFYLTDNYRSYQKILNYATEFKERSRNLLSANKSCRMSFDFKNKYMSDIVGTRGDRDDCVFIAETQSNEEKVRNFTVDGVYTTPYAAKIKQLIMENDFHILVRTNKEVKELAKVGWDRANTIHKSKGLEYDNVIVIDFNLLEMEDVNVGYVALTRAKNKLVVINKEMLIPILLTIPNEHKQTVKIRQGF